MKMRLAKGTEFTCHHAESKNMEKVNKTNSVIKNRNLIE